MPTAPSDYSFCSFWGSSHQFCVMSIRAGEGKVNGEGLFVARLFSIFALLLLMVPCNDELFSVGCKFKVLTLWFQSQVDTVVPLIVPLKL